MKRIAILFVLCCICGATQAPAQLFWELCATPYEVPMRALAAHGENMLFAGNDNGIIRSTNGGSTWTLHNTGLDNKSITALASAPNGDLFACAGYGGGKTPGIYRSSDSGASWSWVVTGLPVRPISSIRILSNGHILVGLQGGGIYRSTNSGAGWDSAGLPGVTVMALLETSEGVLLAATAGGGAGPGISRSIDSGATWQAARVWPAGVLVYSFMAGPDGALYAGTFDTDPMNPNLYRSIDSGATWQAVRWALSNTYVIALVKNRHGHLFAGTRDSRNRELEPVDGIHRSLDSGRSWVPMQAGLYNRNILSIALDSSGYLYAGTTIGVFRTMQAASAPLESRGLVAERMVQGILPNPSQGEGVLHLALPRQGEVTVVLYDAIGSEKERLFSKMLDAGPHAIPFSTGELAAGTYFCHVRQGGRVESCRVVIQK